MSDTKIQDDLNNIPLADDDPQVVIQDEGENGDHSNNSEVMNRQRSLDSLPSSFTNGSSSPGPNSNCLFTHITPFKCSHTITFPSIYRFRS